MNTMVLFFIQIIDMAVLIGCVMSVTCAIPGGIEEKRWKKAAAWIIYGALALFLPMLGYDLLTILVLAVWNVLTGYLLYFHSKMGMVCQIMYHAFLMLAQYMALMIAADIFSILQVELQTYILMLETLRCILLIGVTLILRYMIRKGFQDAPHLKIKGMVIVPMFSAILIFMYLIAGDVFFVRYGYYWCLVFGLLLIVMNLYCLYFWYDVAKNKELRHTVELMEQQRDLTLQYYKEMEKNYDKSRTIIHDIRNHLNAIEQKYKIEDREYIDDVHTMLNSMGMKFYTENRMLNIILNDKLKGIPQDRVDCNLGGIGLEFIADIDITTIFANLLENAVEAGRGHDDFRVKIRGEEIQDFTIVKISNPLYVPYQEGKSAKSGHEGIGLQNVKKAVEKYQGEIQIQTAGQMFSVTLLFTGSS